MQLLHVGIIGPTTSCTDNGSKFNGDWDKVMHLAIKGCGVYVGKVL